MKKQTKKQKAPKAPVMKNGTQTTEAVYDFLRTLKKQTTFAKAYTAAKRLKKFQKLTQVTFYNHVKRLEILGTVTLTTTRDLHPKRKPVYLINPVKK